MGLPRGVMEHRIFNSVVMTLLSLMSTLYMRSSTTFPNPIMIMLELCVHVLLHV